ncbi:NepR family anti-sigma factor [Sphingomonas sp. KC8]|uniref:NepR family anti-sigma factor n=1 Tax=Sphingomonas sp. KC8 TaxID=1030157 RepID=UPI00178C5BD2|nr:NepR family anti-sigma factor [Sphingomonas sp. KC8]
MASTENAPRQAEKPRRRNASHIGQALRSAWDETLGEQVPSDMLDLLGKLN